MINNEDQLDEMMNLNQDEQYKDNSYHKIIKKGIRNKIYKRTLIIFIILSIFMVSIYFSTSFILNQINYNPFNESGIQINESEEKDTTTFNLLMKHYISIYYPGISYYGYPTLDTANGFSSYTIHATFADLFDGLNTGIDIKKMYINHSKLTMNEINILNPLVQFYNTETGCEYGITSGEKDICKEDSKALVNEYINKIKQMPDSAIIDLSLTFKEKMDINDFVNFSNEYNNSNFVYLLANIINFDCYGFNENDQSYYEYSESFNKKYPNIAYKKNRSAKELSERYLSLLSLMIDNQQFFDLASSAFVEESEVRYENLKKEYQTVKESGLKIMGTRVYANKEDALNLLSSNDVEYANINNAKFSEFEKQ